MALWNYCAICGKRIEAGDPCLGVEEKNAETAGDSICFDCVKIENINGLDKTVSITDLLARAEAAEARAEKAERERDAAVEVLRLNHWCDDCKYYAVTENCKNDWECQSCQSPCYCGRCEEGSLWDWKGKEE